MDQKVRDRWLAARVKHGAYVGGTESPTHYIWRSMLRRCADDKNPHYGGRGVEVCSRWRRYENFLADMGERPSEHHSIDRIDNNCDYTKANCRWATRSEQQKNKRSTRRYTNGAFEGTLIECAKHLGVSKELAHWRFKTWGTFEKGDTSWHELPKEP